MTWSSSIGLALAAALAGAVWLLRPRIGRWWRGRERVQIEDALKHLFQFESQGRAASLQSLAGALALPIGRATRLLERLESRDLVAAGELGLRLTAAGRAAATRVVRVHRLWESYLADATGYREREWHREADRREHRTSAQQTEALAARLGHPLFDPHGDPIPSAAGQLPPQRGRPLAWFAPGDWVVIVHLEDEPVELYAELVSKGLCAGQRLRLQELSSTAIRFQVEGRTETLSMLAAAQLLAEPGPPADDHAGAIGSLAALPLGAAGRVSEISPACRGVERRRLMDLGLVPGTEVRAEMDSPAGGVRAYRIRGALIALRGEQAEHVRLLPLRESI